MKINTKALALTLGIFGAGTVLLVSLLNLASNSYGLEFLKLVASVYPGYEFNGSVVDVIIGTLYGFADGFFGGAVFGWLYNFIVGRS